MSLVRGRGDVYADGSRCPDLNGVAASPFCIYELGPRICLCRVSECRHREFFSVYPSLGFSQHRHGAAIAVDEHSIAERPTEGGGHLSEDSYWGDCSTVWKFDDRVG